MTELKSKKQLICEFLNSNPDSGVRALENALGMKSHLMGVHLARLKREGYIANPVRGHYRVTDKGRNLAMGTGLLKVEGIEKRSKKEKQNKQQDEQADKVKKSTNYRIIIQGASFVHDEIVDELTAREITALLNNKKIKTNITP